MVAKKTIIVCCAIILKEDRILVAQRGEKMSLPLKWEFPGGKIDIGESSETCIKREIKEELNISIKIIERLKNYPYDYSNFSIILIPFITKYLEGELILTEHKQATWFRLDELLNLDWAAADLPILHDFLNVKYA